MLTGGQAPNARTRTWSRFPLVLGGLGGLGLLSCATCCTLPLLGAIGLASGFAAISGVLRPVSAALLGIGVVLAVVGVIRRRRTCGAAGGSCSTSAGASHSHDDTSGAAGS
jgi:hypothetical protein